MGKIVFCMWSRETFLRVRVWLVERRDALVQIFAILDWDKNSSIGVAGCSLVAMKRKRGVTYGRTCVCYKDYQSSLWVRKDLQSGLSCFFIRLACERDRQTDSTGAYEISTCDKKETSLKNVLFASHFTSFLNDFDNFHFSNFTHIRAKDADFNPFTLVALHLLKLCYIPLLNFLVSLDHMAFLFD